MGRKDVYKDAKGFDVNPQNINRKGQPHKTIAAVNINLEAEGHTEASKQDIVSCYLRLINLPIPELEKLVKNDEQPALIRIVGKAILSGKGFDVIDKILDRGIGKAIQTMDITVTDGEGLKPKEEFLSKLSKVKKDE